MDELLQALRVSSPHLDTTKVPFDASGNHVSIVHLVASISKTQLGTVKKFIKKYENHECMRLLKPHVLKGSSAYMLSGDAQATAHALSHWPSQKVKNVCQNLPSDASGPVPMETEVPVIAPDQKSTQAANGTIARKPLVLNGITIEVDPQTLMVNATQMCRAVGKLFGHYRRLDSTEEFLQELSSNIHIRILDLVKSNQGGNHSGTWVDWRVALHLAQWLSPAVQVQVTGWIDELRNENDQLLTQIEELQAAAVDAPPAIAINGARKPLVLNGITIEVDPQTLMVNATQMCRVVPGKRWFNYYQLDSTKEFLKSIGNLKAGITAFDLVQSKPGHNGGTFVHRYVAYDLARWLSADVSLQFTMWVDELMLTGRVELGKEATNEELNQKWEQRVKDLFAAHSSERALSCDDEEDRRIKRRRDDMAFEDERNRKNILFNEELKQKALLAAEELNKQTALNAEELKKQAALTAEELKKQTALTAEELKKQAALTAEELNKQAALAAEELNERKQRTLLAEEELKKQAALTAEELKKKSLEISNEKITMMLNLEKDITPFLQKQISSCDAHIMSKSKDVYLAMVTQIKNFVTGDSEVAGVIKYCKDITSIARELGFRSLTQGEKTSIGVMIATEYLSRTGQAPLKIVKDVNGADREVNTYHEEHDVWIRPLIQKRLDEMRGTGAPPMSQRNPSATINKYFSTQ